MDQQPAQQLTYIKKYIRNIPDFPKDGIQFKDITPLLKDPKALKCTSQLLQSSFSDDAVDYVAGLESRGFLFGPRLAQDLDAGFILIRKPGKLPAETVEVQYELEYSTDTIEMHKDAISEGDRVLIHDDLIATGGSAQAATRMIKECGGEIVGYSFIISLSALEGQNKLPDDVQKSTLLNL